MHLPSGAPFAPILSRILFLGSLCLPAIAHADVDEPGLLPPLDEPDATLSRPHDASEADASAFRVEVAFGLSSLVVDPDINQGIGGGVYVAYGLQSWIGVEASVFASHNTYKGKLGDISAAFSGGNISLGPIFQVTRPGSRLSITIDLGIGFYHVAPTIQEGIWTLGISAGLTIGARLTPWFGLGIKPRYHLHNLATISGPDLVDLKSLRTVGVIDRLEIPAYVAFYF